MITSVLFFLGGLVLLVLGANGLVDGASALARRYGVSDLAIGLTIVAFGTSAPELVVNVVASLQKHEGIVFGNIIGSNNFNLFMILGLSGIIVPLSVQKSTVWKEIPISLFAAIFLFVVCNDFFAGDATLTRMDGGVLLLFFVLFLYYVYKQLRTEQEEHSGPVATPLRSWLFIVAGLAGLVFGGRLVVLGATQIAESAGVSEQIIGLTIVAAGTSMPELATSLVAAFRRNSDIAVGNIIGSNIFNVFFILGLSALVNPLPYDVSFNRDLIILSAGTCFLFLAMFTGKRGKLDRWESGLLLAGYISYTTYLVANTR